MGASYCIWGPRIQGICSWEVFPSAPARSRTLTSDLLTLKVVCGSLPFRGESSGVIFEAILNRDPVLPLRLNPDLPPKLEDIISRALEKDRELRYQSAKEMRAELLRLKRDTESGRTAAVEPAPAAPLPISPVWRASCTRRLRRPG
jgi:serine/threonine protein kinase